MKYTELINAALDARKNAYSPYSGFKVGAALLCGDGTVFCGCNIENSSYGATCCAERIALFDAVKNGYKDFSAIAVVGGKDDIVCAFCPPCGICRQVMSEFCKGDFEILLFDGNGEKIITLDELLPYSFTGENL